MENNTINSIDGATALKLDENYQLDEEQSQSIENMNNDLENTKSIQSAISSENLSNDIPRGVSIESAAYIENYSAGNKEEDTNLSDNIDEEYTPKLFSEDQNNRTEENIEINSNEEDTNQLFDQDLNEDEEFEIPAFLRKQKF